jgi:hypothetical protein
MRGHEQSQMERVEAVNRLSRALADSQAQCQHLMASNNSSEQILNLRHRVQQLEVILLFIQNANKIQFSHSTMKNTMSNNLIQQI